LLLTSFSFAQTEDNESIRVRFRGLSDEQINQSSLSKLIFASEISEAKTLALKDIENGTPFLLLAGGIASTFHTPDLSFEDKYGVYFYDYGCVSAGYEFMTAYNEIIFELLETKYGKKWMKEIRKDVIGFKQWEKKSK